MPLTNKQIQEKQAKLIKSMASFIAEQQTEQLTESLTPTSSQDVVKVDKPAYKPAYKPYVKDEDLEKRVQQSHQKASIQQQVQDVVGTSLRKADLVKLATENGFNLKTLAHQTEHGETIDCEVYKALITGNRKVLAKVSSSYFESLSE